MYYKEAYEIFLTDYENEMKNAGKQPRKLEPGAVLSFLSRAYAYIGNTYELVEGDVKQVNLVSGQYEYTTGTGHSNIPKSVLRIHTVKRQDASETQLDKVGLLYMPRGERESGVPTKWSVQGTNSARKLILNTSPDKSYADDNTYALSVYHKEQITIFTGTATDSFSNFNLNSAGWGGEFKLPTEWDMLIIQGALAEAMSSSGKRQEFYQMAKLKILEGGDKSKSYQSRKVPYRLGVWKGQGGG